MAAKIFRAEKLQTHVRLISAKVSVSSLILQVLAHGRMPDREELA